MVENKKSKDKMENKTEEIKEEKIETKALPKDEVSKDKKEKKPEVKKDKAVANATSLRISTKASISVCKVIRGKTPESAVKRLEEVIKERRVIPMASREVGHQKGKGIAGGRFPKNACKDIIGVIKQLQANSIIAGIENPIITIAKADKGSAPFRRDGRKGKRTHIHLEAMDKSKLADKKIKLNKKKK